MEAVILAGGDAWRLKPDTWTPKPLLELKRGYTLLEHQVDWLERHNITEIIVATNMETFDSMPDRLKKRRGLNWRVEYRKLGTGGALKWSLRMCRGEHVYVMNVDDILEYNPLELYENRWSGVVMVVTKPRLPFGRVVLKGSKVLGFEEKPKLHIYVSCGHYVWNRKLALQLLPEEGDLETETLPKLAEMGLLKALPVNANWITINTYKDYLKAVEYFKGRH